MAAAAAGAPAALPAGFWGSYEDNIGFYRGDVAPDGREFIVLTHPDRESFGHIADSQGRVFVEEGKVVNLDPEKEHPAELKKVNPAVIAARGGNPAIPYWNIYDLDVDERNERQVDSSGGTMAPAPGGGFGDPGFFQGGYNYDDNGGGTGATGSGRRTSNYRRYIVKGSSSSSESESDLESTFCRSVRAWKKARHIFAKH
jgi:hypothetical protein